MQLRSLKKLKLMMTIQEVSGRQLATVAGYKSHAYMSRILRGEVDTLETEPAVRIAHFFGASIDDLFIVRVSNQTGRNDRSNAA